jgi:hypothetical protein
MRVLPFKAHTNLAIANSRPDWAVSSVVEHCLHTAGVTSSKLVPPTKIINNINGSTPLTGDWQYSASIADAQGESDRGFAAASVSSSKLRYLNLPDLP